MNRRTEIKQDKRRKNRLKWLVGCIAAFIIVTTSLTVVHAQLDVQAIIANWFDKKKTESIHTIEEAINEEKTKQIARLQEEIQHHISNTSQEIERFTEQEKLKRIEKLREYADQLIANLHDEEINDEEVIQAFDRIVEEAMQKMDAMIEPQQDTSEN